MTFADLPRSASVFLDANTFVYHFMPHPLYGNSCSDLLTRIERQELLGLTSTHILTELAHRLMTHEASQVFGWSGKVVQHLKRQPTAIHSLHKFQTAIQELLTSTIQILAIAPHMLAAATAVSRQSALLSNDALLVAVMQHHGITDLASQDSDFDRVSSLVRYCPD
jgi:predicted nucleic acid-binding protein